MTCAWCGRAVSSWSERQIYCSQRCRQAAFRLRRRRSLEVTLAEPGRFAYADPPYPGLSAKYYGDEPDFAGEVDHRALIASLEAGSYTGWALSTSSKALADVLPLCPAGARVCAWVKPIGVPPRTAGLHSTWEPLIVVRGRQQPPGVRDWLRAQPARREAGMVRSVAGRKPLAFCAWLFDCLGMLPGDELLDLFPGSGVVGRAWASVGADGDPSSGAATRRSPAPGADGASRTPRGDRASLEYSRHAGARAMNVVEDLGDGGGAR